MNKRDTGSKYHPFPTFLTIKMALYINKILQCLKDIKNLKGGRKLKTFSELTSRRKYACIDLIIAFITSIIRYYNVEFFF